MDMAAGIGVRILTTTFIPTMATVAIMVADIMEMEVIMADTTEMAALPIQTTAAGQIARE